MNPPDVRDAPTLDVVVRHESDAADRPVLSVVVPTFNRRERLADVLDALEHQTLARSSYEIVVVSDGSTDGTLDMLTTRAKDGLVVIDQANGGPAAARNAGVAAARGTYILFVDDDVVASPDLLAAHLRAHGVGSARVVIGPMLDAPGHRYQPWVAWEQRMLAKQYDAMLAGRYAASYRQFYTGNASVARELLVDVGGFDPSYRRAEDVELARRLAAAGAEFVFEPEARGFHLATRTYESWRAIADAYGRNEIRFAQRQGEAFRWKLLREDFRSRHVVTRVVAAYAMGHSRRIEVSEFLLRGLARIAHRTGLGGVSSVALSTIFNITYYAGAADELGDSRTLRRMLLRRGEGGIGLVLEQTLGHVTHGKNLVRLMPLVAPTRIVAKPIEFEVSGVPSRLPLFGSNWTVRAGVRARRALRSLVRREQVDVVFIHTQVPATLAGRWLRAVPTVVSLDATPLQYDRLGASYGHATQGRRAEQFKFRLNRSVLQRAAHVVAWSAWASESIVDDYGIDSHRVSVIAPGVDLELWTPDVDRQRGPTTDGVVRILFVGGDLERKGGIDLIRAVTRLRAETAEAGIDVRLDLVTGATVEPPDGVTVHRGLTSNSPDLIELYRRADVFCLPTVGDCLPMVLSEAAAMRLPLVSTSVAAIPEIVRPDISGILVEPGDVDGLTNALRRLVQDPELRSRLGDGARRLVEQEYDAKANARRLASLLASSVAGSRGLPA